MYVSNNTDIYNMHFIDQVIIIKEHSEFVQNTSSLKLKLVEPIKFCQVYIGYPSCTKIP